MLHLSPLFPAVSRLIIMTLSLLTDLESSMWHATPCLLKISRLSSFFSVASESRLIPRPFHSSGSSRVYAGASDKNPVVEETAPGDRTSNVLTLYRVKTALDELIELQSSPQPWRKNMQYIDSISAKLDSHGKPQEPY